MGENGGEIWGKVGGGGDKRVTEKEREESRGKCKRACFYGRSGKIWGEGFLHHRGEPMKRLR